MKTFPRFFRLQFLLALTIMATACSGFPARPPVGGEFGWIDWNGEGGWSGSAASPGEVMEFGEGFDLALEEVAPASVPMPTSSKSRSESDEVSQGSYLRAGSVDDNASWDDYLLYRIRFAEWGIQANDVDVSERHIFTITTEGGTPVLGAKITIEDGQGHEIAVLRTHSDGRALFFPEASPYPEAQSMTVRIEKDEADTVVPFDRSEREHTIVLSARSASNPIRLDVHFLIDSTGSMSDEIQQLKDNMIMISERIHELDQAPDVRFGMTVYRDRGDLFTSRSMEFTPDVEAFIEELGEVVAEGGGDYPESLNEGLHNAIHMPEWRIDETISLMFLVADAPPQMNYPNDFDYAEEVFETASRGIKIIPIASSGLDDQGEYIFRQLAQITGGKFLFLTYGAGGAPGDETTHHVDDYSVLSLDELVVRLVAEELEALNPSQ